MDIETILKNIDNFFETQPKEVIDEIDAKMKLVRFDDDISIEEYCDAFNVIYRDAYLADEVIYSGQYPVMTKMAGPINIDGFANSLSQNEYTDTKSSDTHCETSEVWSQVA